MAVRYKNLSDIFNSPAPAVARIIGVTSFVIFGALLGTAETDPDAGGTAIVFLGIAVWLTSVAYYQGRRRELAGYYLSELVGRTHVPIIELARKRRLPSKKIQREIYLLIHDRYMPGASVGTVNGCLSLVFKYECNIREGWPGDESAAAGREKPAAARNRTRDAAERKEGVKTAPVKETISEETRLVIKEGRAGVEAIKKVNASLPDEAISEKLGKLEKITEEIFNYVESHPEKVNDIRKLMSYHLPAALKLVKAYKELEALPVKAASIISAKTDIQNAVSTINVAFEKVLNDLYEDMVLDVTAEISALRVILAQDGLTRAEDFPADTGAEYGGETTDKEKNEKD